MTSYVVVGLVTMLAALPPASSIAGSECEVDGRYAMGTILQLEVCASASALRHAAIADAFAAARSLDALLTTYSPDSPVSELNRHAGAGPLPLPPEVIEVLALARGEHVRTAGTFDVTVGPLIALWHDAAARQELPSSEALDGARERVGSLRIALAPDGSAAALRDPGMKVDLGGIGKGYALDRLAGRLRAQGVERALLDFGRSSVWALGSPPGAAAWRILLEHPSGGAIGVLRLRDVALSVSGSLAQGASIAGQRYGHVIDPRTGWPLQRDLLAAVIAPRADLAEVLSKALLVLGEVDGIALLDTLDSVAGLLVEADGLRWSSRGWDARAVFEPSRPR